MAADAREPSEADPLASVRWFWRDWRASTARACMSPLERGIYRELLDAHYASEDCTIPDDDAVLAALADVPASVWARVKDKVLRWIPVVSPGKRQNPRVLAEWSKGRNLRAAKQIAARRGNAKRWGGDRRTTQEESASDRTAIAQRSHSDDSAIAKRSPPSPSPSPSPGNPQKDSPDRAREAAPPGPLAGPSVASRVAPEGVATETSSTTTKVPSAAYLAFVQKRVKALRSQGIKPILPPGVEVPS